MIIFVEFFLDMILIEVGCIIIQQSNLIVITKMQPTIDGFFTSTARFWFWFWKQTPYVLHHIIRLLLKFQLCIQWILRYVLRYVSYFHRNITFMFCVHRISMDLRYVSKIVIVIQIKYIFNSCCCKLCLVSTKQLRYSVHGDPWNNQLIPFSEFRIMYLH